MDSRKNGLMGAKNRKSGKRGPNREFRGPGAKIRVRGKNPGSEDRNRFLGVVYQKSSGLKRSRAYENEQNVFPAKCLKLKTMQNECDAK